MDFTRLKRQLSLGLIVLLLGATMGLPLGAASSQPAAQPLRVVFALQPGGTIQALSQQVALSQIRHLFGPAAGLPATYSATLESNLLHQLSGHSLVQYAKPDLPVAAAAITTTDPFFTTDEAKEDQQWYLAKIKLPEAWEHGKGSSSVKVAIVDTGIRTTHLDLNDGRIGGGYDSIEDKSIPAGVNSDDNGHGTAVAGVIGAIPNNGKGIAGINWSISLMPVKALSADGTGAISTVAAGIVWAADHGADIINLSLGGPGFGSDQTLNNAIIHAYQKGAVIVSAAGNDLADHGANLDTDPVYPICADGGENMVIGVAATDVNDRKADFSNFGINCVDIAAPGKKILTTAYLPSDPSDNILIYGSGTSLATPIVSGVAALLKANNPRLTNAEIKNIILRTADNIDVLNQNNCLNSSCNGFLGSGRINALSALAPQPLLDGTLVRENASEKIYLVTGGKKRFVSGFVFTQRGYSLGSVVNDTNNGLVNLPNGSALPPLDGTLIKAQTDPTVYVIHQELKRPLTYLVFQSRGYSFAKVQTLPDPDVTVLTSGEWYWPPDGTMVVVRGNPTVYVMDQGLARPVTYFVFTQRRLSFQNVVTVTPDEFGHIPRPNDPYWLAPAEGTLVKSADDPTVYVISEGSRRALAYEIFIARKYRFSDVKTLPQAEMIVIQLGPALSN